MTAKYRLPWNPWRVLDQQRAYAADPVMYRIEKALIEGEYAGCPEPEPCECGRRRFWRATVGVLMCPDCRSMRLADGTVKVAPGYTPEWQFE